MPLLSKFLFFGYVYALMADLLIRCLSLANNKNISYIDQSTLVFHDSALFGARNVYPWYDRHFIVCVCECSVVEVFFSWCLWLWTVLCWLFGLPPAHNIFRSYITEDTLCFSFFLCLCEVMVSKLGCNYISGIINGIAYMFLYAFNELSKKWIVELPVSLSTFPWPFPCLLSYTLISYVDQIRM
jgi:hypothetical protein